MPFKNDEFPYSLCDHPEDRLEFIRNESLYQWEGRCFKCGCGPGISSNGPPIVRTDEDIESGKVPDVSKLDKFNNSYERV